MSEPRVLLTDLFFTVLGSIPAPRLGQDRHALAEGCVRIAEEDFSGSRLLDQAKLGAMVEELDEALPGDSREWLLVCRSDILGVVREGSGKTFPAAVEAALGEQGGQAGG